MLSEAVASSLRHLLHALHSPLNALVLAFKPIVGSVRIWPRSAFGDRAAVVTVTDGQDYDTLRRGEPDTLSATYDRGTRRAFYSFRSARQ